MKKGLFAVVCVLAILSSMLVVPASAQSVLSEGAGYEVGYAKVDINPWINLKLADGTTIGLPDQYTEHVVTTTINDPKNPAKTISQKIIDIPLAGYGNSLERLANTMMDDNGDGYVGYGDGIYATCTTVTDQYGTTVLYVTLDCIRASEGMTRDIRNGVVAALGADTIAAERIMLSSSHSHSAPDFGYCSQNTVWKAYYDYVIDRIVNAAKNAFETKSPAVMSKGSIEAPEGMQARGYGEGYSLNYVRHGVATGTLVRKTYENGKLKKTSTKTGTVIRSAHGGGSFTQDLPNSTYTGTLYKSTVTVKDPVSDADETLHVLRFVREEGDPVLLVNWRAHAAMTGGSSDLRISSDYVNSLRYQLEKKGYCVGFWQGASGNINGGSLVSGEAKWQDLNINGLDRTAKYGYLLAEVTVACLNRYMVDCDMGAIRSRQGLFEVQALTDEPGLIAAAKACQAQYGSVWSDSIKYPYMYEHTDGMRYVLNSDYHANQVLYRENRTDPIEMELNVMMLGEDVALVTLPVEAFDRYSLDATMSNTTANDWNNLIGETYGTPFVLGYSNGHEGYLPNALSYEYNDFPSTEAYYRIYGKGCYESDTAKMAKGSGEAVIAELAALFRQMDNDNKTGYCQACDADVTWSMLTQNQLGRDLENGHYYLAENITADHVYANIKVGSSDSTEKICLDLNGKTLDHKGQVFEVYTGSTLNIMDTGAGGKIIGRTGGDVQGGVVLVGSKATLNLYGGTLQFIKDASYTGNPVGRGGVICSSGYVYMYGGTIIGGELSLVSSSVLPSYNGVGGAVYVSGGTGRFHMYGGHVRAYTGATETGVVGNCVYVQSTYGVTDKDSGGGFYLYGDAVVDEIYIEAHQYSSYRNVSVSGEYTGSVAFCFAPSVSLDGEIFIAHARNGANISGADLRCTNQRGSSFRISGSKLYMKAGTYDAEVNGTRYKTIAEAMQAYQTGTIKLLRDVETITVDKAVELLDLNGYNVGSVTVNEGYTLTCTDSQTKDFTVDDAFGYGVIQNITGKVAVQSTDEQLYLMLGDDTNNDGAADRNVSFHRVRLELTAISLRAKPDQDACNPSVYYKSVITGDAVVKTYIKNYGVAISAVEVPNADNMGVTNQFSRFDGAAFHAGIDGSATSSTLLYGVLKESNSPSANGENAGMQIYGRPYIQLKDGRYFFGGSYTVTLKELTEAIDARWDAYTETQKDQILTMYDVYQDIMSGWNVDKIKEAYRNFG